MTTNNNNNNNSRNMSAKKKKTAKKPVHRAQVRPVPKPARVSVGVATPRVTTNYYAPTRKMKRNGLSCSYTSRDYIGGVTITSSSVQGDIMLQYALSPLLNTGTRLYTEALQWERYKVKKWSFEFVTTQSKMDTGQVLAFVDPDPLDHWANDPTNMERGIAQGRARPANIWQNFTVELPMAPVAEYFTNPANTSDSRFSTAGVLRIINAGGFKLNGDSSRVVYNVYQHVELEFMQPELTLSSAVALAEVVSSNPTFNSLFSGANVSFAGIPVSISNGEIRVDTGSIGSNNLFVELSTTVQNMSNVAGTVAASLGLSGSDVYDIVTTAARSAATTENGTATTSVTFLSALLSGEVSWSIAAFLTGILTALPKKVIVRFFTVPASVTKVHKARAHLRLGAVEEVAADIGSTSAYMLETNQTVSIGPGSLPEDIREWKFFNDGKTDSGGWGKFWNETRLGFNPYWSVDNSGAGTFELSWRTTGPGERIDIVKTFELSLWFNPTANPNFCHEVAFYFGDSNGHSDDHGSIDMRAPYYANGMAARYLENVTDVVSRSGSSGQYELTNDSYVANWDSDTLPDLQNPGYVFKQLVLVWRYTFDVVAGVAPGAACRVRLPNHSIYQDVNGYTQDLTGSVIRGRLLITASPTSHGIVYPFEPMSPAPPVVITRPFPSQAEVVSGKVKRVEQIKRSDIAASPRVHERR